MRHGELVYMCMCENVCVTSTMVWHVITFPHTRPLRHMPYHNRSDVTERGGVQEAEECGEVGGRGLFHFSGSIHSHMT